MAQAQRTIATAKHRVRKQRISCSRCEHLETPDHVLVVKGRERENRLCRDCQRTLVTLGLQHDL